MDLNAIAKQEEKVKALGESCTECYYEEGTVHEDLHHQYLQANNELERMKGHPAAHKQIVTKLFKFLQSDNWEVALNHICDEFSIGDLEAALEFDCKHIVVTRGDSTNMIGLIKLFHHSDEDPVDEGIEVLYYEYQINYQIEHQLMFCLRQILKRYLKELKQTVSEEEKGDLIDKAYAKAAAMGSIELCTEFQDLEEVPEGLTSDEWVEIVGYEISNRPELK